MSDSARHVVLGLDRPSSLSGTPGVVFLGDRYHTIPARRLDVASEPDDLAVLEAAPPQGQDLPRAPMVLAAQLPRGTWVWNIGLHQDWDWPDRAGGLGPPDPVTGFRRVSQLRTPPGASGGAGVTDGGVIGIVLSDAGAGSDYSLLLPVERIVQLFAAWDLPVNLLTSLPAAPSAPMPGDAAVRGDERQLERYISEHPGVYDQSIWNAHNELRHLYITKTPPDVRKSFEHANAILKYWLMDDYILHIMSDWRMDNDNSVARINLQRNAKTFPDLKFIAAACVLKIGDLYAKDGWYAKARSYYEQLAKDNSPDLAQYRLIAEERLRNPSLKPGANP